MISERLELVPATLELCRAELEGRSAVARVLGAEVPLSWPPPVFEPEDLERLRRHLENEPAVGAWTLHYVIVGHDAGQRVLVGVAGYVGPPSPEGSVEIGYAIAEEHQRRGYATEAVRMLVTSAFGDTRVELVTATTYATLTPSIGVLTKAGFARLPLESVSGLVRYERRREPQTGEAGSVRPDLPSGQRQSAPGRGGSDGSV